MSKLQSKKYKRTRMDYYNNKIAISVVQYLQIFI